MPGSTDVLFVVYIRTNHLKNTALFIFKNSQPCPKIIHVQKVIEYMNVFGKYFRVRKEFSNKIQTSISFNKDKLQNSIENNRIKYLTDALNQRHQLH